jgi:hypothetical protein
MEERNSKRQKKKFLKQLRAKLLKRKPRDRWQELIQNLIQYVQTGADIILSARSRIKKYVAKITSTSKNS